MTPCTIDHITVTAPTLESGADFVLRALGVAMHAGGAHPRMGTHNMLLRLGDAAFLEVIAPDPNAPAIARPRWFALDDRVANREPRLATWVARTDDLGASPPRVLADLGAIETMTRGTRTWLITIPADGHLPMGGAAPALIEWTDPRRPAAMDLPDFGCRLEDLSVRHQDPDRLRALLGSLGLAEAVKVLPCGAAERPGPVARIATPHGTRTLGVSA